MENVLKESSVLYDIQRTIGKIYKNNDEHEQRNNLIEETVKKQNVLKGKHEQA